MGIRSPIYVEPWKGDIFIRRLTTGSERCKQCNNHRNQFGVPLVCNFVLRTSNFKIGDSILAKTWLCWSVHYALSLRNIHLTTACGWSIPRIIIASLFVVCIFALTYVLFPIVEKALISGTSDFFGYFGVREHSVRSNRATSSEK